MSYDYKAQIDFSYTVQNHLLNQFCITDMIKTIVYNATVRTDIVKFICLRQSGIVNFIAINVYQATSHTLKVSFYILYTTFVSMERSMECIQTTDSYTKGRKISRSHLPIGFLLSAYSPTLVSLHGHFFRCLYKLTFRNWLTFKTENILHFPFACCCMLTSLKYISAGKHFPLPYFYRNSNIVLAYCICL